MKRISFAFLAVFAIFQARAETTDLRLICEHPAPLGQEARLFLFEIMLNDRLVRSTNLVDGLAADKRSYVISTADENVIVGVAKDDAGRLTDSVSINRLTAETVFHWYVYGADRDKVWNNQLKRQGGFVADPVRLSSAIFRCRNAVKQL